MPTIGQLFPDSLLVLPKSHIETMASLPADVQADLCTFVSELQSVIGSKGPIIAFEHGARCDTGGGCGIYHAHLHLVPVPSRVSADSLLRVDPNSESIQNASSLCAALGRLRASTEYLLVQDTEHCVRFLDLSVSSGARYPSQYFRRALADLFRLEDPWDWRAYTEPEQSLFDTLDLFENPHAIVGR
jgi:diadenosine tetraphosphate (Ap4A) HIT family hydrolase